MILETKTRRRDFCLGGLWLVGVRTAGAQGTTRQEAGFRPLFDGTSLRGWKRVARNPKKPSLGKWTVENGVIVGGQDPVGVGSYLVSEESFADFELQIEARPDWPVDTGIMVRAIPEGHTGIQVLLDHRPHGGIGGFYGNGIGRFHAYEYAFNSDKDKDGQVVRLVPEKPTEQSIRVPLDYAAPVETFLKAWKPGGWNHFRIRSVGALPRLTTWINGEKISELETAKMKAPGYDPEKMLGLIGRSGHIALEVHDNDPKMGNDRWAPGAVTRWRNISIKNL